MKNSKLILPLLAILLATSCASIVSRSVYPVTFSSDPSGASLTIENRDGRVIYNGTTPTTIPLSSSAGYMRREQYKVTFRIPGCEPHTTYIFSELNGWYFGNILIGGLIGFLIVDPATGAMYRLPNELRTVFPETEGNEESFRELKILEIDNLPEEIDQEWLVPLEL